MIDHFLPTGDEDQRGPARLNLKRANWGVYREEVTNRLANVDLKACSLPAAIDKFNKALLGAARIAAPFGSVRKPKACERAHRAVMRAFRRVQAQEPGAAEDYMLQPGMQRT